MIAAGMQEISCHLKSSLDIFEVWV